MIGLLHRGSVATQHGASGVFAVSLAVAISLATPDIARWQVSLSSVSVGPGGSVEVRVDGFMADEAVDLFLGATEIAVARADPTGRVSVEISIPRTENPGRTWLTALGRQSGIARQTRIRIVPGSGASWPMYGADAGHTGANQDEQWLTPLTIGQLEEAWRTVVSVLHPGESVPTGGGDNPFGQGATPSAYVNGTLYAVWWARYVATDGSWRNRGVVFALDPATGAVRWSWVYEGTVMPNLAVADGTVVVAAEDLVGLDASTGEVRWSLPPTGRDASWIRTFGDRPIVLDETVLVTSGVTRGDSVFAIDPSTGEALWSSAVRWADLLVADRSGIYVRTSVGRAGAIAALDPGDSSLRWTLEGVGGPMLLAPGTIVAGGSALLALDARDGKTRWTFDPWSSFQPTLPGRIIGRSIDAIAAADGIVFARADITVCQGNEPEPEERCPSEHRLYALSLDDGTVHWEQDEPAGWWGSVAGGVLYPDGARAGLDTGTGSRVWDGIGGNAGADILVADG